MDYLFNGISLQNGRATNMDSLLIKRGAIADRNALLAVVCDGVGSLRDGAFASGTAVKMLSRWFDGITVIDRIGILLRDSVLNINGCIFSEAKRLSINTASTLSALLLIDDYYYIVHIGDSRVYSFSNNALTQITNDDVSENGNLTGCIGRSESIFLQYFEGRAADKVFLLCTDGLYKRMDNEFLTVKVGAWNGKQAKEPMESLPRYVTERGELDNISFALVKIKD